MVVSLSSRELLVLTLSVLLIIFGIGLLLSITQINDVGVLDNLKPGQRYSVDVTPERAQQGTTFFVKAQAFLDEEQQNINLFVTNGSFSYQVNLYDDGKHFDDESKDGIYGGYFDSKNLGLGNYELRDLDNNLLEKFSIITPGCYPAYGTYGKGKTNFAILPYGYSDWNEFEEEANEIIKTQNAFLTLEPMALNKNKFSFILVNISEDLECEIGCNGIPTGICCNSDKVYEQAATCSYDSIVVLANSNTFCGLASGYAAICSDNPLSHLIFAHELGHTFGGLADEYVYADAFSNYDIPEYFITNTPNCDVAECNKWNNITNVCIPGCTASNLYRSSERSLMGSPLYPEYNIVSKLQLQRRIDTREVKGVSGNLGEEKSYYVDLHYNKGSLSVTNIHLRPVSSNPINQDSKTIISILDGTKEIYNLSIEVPIFEEFANESGLIAKDEFDFVLLMPYFPQADKLEIKGDGKVIETTSLEVFSARCGDRICSNSENHYSCSNDCSLERDNFCEYSKCDPNCPSQENCIVKKNIISISAIVMILIGAIIILGIFFRPRKSKINL